MLQFLKKQVNLLLTAIMFFTRIPVKAPYNQELLNKCNRYFPIVGLLVGGFGAFAFYLSSFLFPVQVSVVISMISTIWLTGAFHEDGLCDVCDALGGGWTKEKILDIMKDSRVGAYGAIGIILTLLLKFSILSSLPEALIPISIIVGHIISRSVAVTTMASLIYVREDELSKSKPITKNIQTKDWIIALTTGVLSILLFQDIIFFILIPVLFVVKIALERWFKKWIGGYTGDCLGTVQQVSEIVTLLTILAILNTSKEIISCLN